MSSASRCAGSIAISRMTAAATRLSKTSGANCATNKRLGRRERSREDFLDLLGQPRRFVRLLDEAVDLFAEAVQGLDLAVAARREHAHVAPDRAKLLKRDFARHHRQRHIEQHQIDLRSDGPE